MNIFLVLLTALPFFLYSLTIEEKIGQMLIVHFNGTTANNDAKKLIQEAHVGGFIYYNWANELTSKDQVKQLSTSLQSLAKIPLFISVDQEGGRVNRLKNEFTHFPSNHVIAQSHHVEDAKHMAVTIGEELTSVGINVNYAPVVDISSGDNPVIGDRSFGSNPLEVTEFGKQALEGYNSVGVIAVLKHFPGYGSVQTDAHADLPILNKTLEQLEQFELIPYYTLANHVHMIMPSHILMPQIDPEHCASTSRIFLQDILRKKIGFKGIIVCDSLVMQGLLNHCGDVKRAAKQAILAGCDLLILGGKQLLENQTGYELTTNDVLAIHSYLVELVKSGKIPQAIIDDAVERILKVKSNV